jgi:hypothetical protein
VDRVELGVHAVDAPDALDEAGWIPRDVVIDDDIRAMEVDALREDLGAHEDAVLVTGVEGVRIEICDHVLMGLFAGLPREQDDFGLDFLGYLVGKIRSRLLRLGEDNQFPFLQLGLRVEDFTEGLPFWITPDLRPEVQNRAKNR